jgi:hypothetical protein
MSNEEMCMVMAQIVLSVNPLMKILILKINKISTTLIA